MIRGYIKIWRKIEDSGLIQNATALQLAMWCLLKATHKKRKQIVGTSSVELLPGQFVFGRKVAAQELKTTEQRIRTSLKVLKKMEFLTINPTNKYSIVSIINWGIYQMEQPTTNQQSNQVPTSSQPAANHKQECKHVKKEKKKIEKKESPIEYPAWLNQEMFQEFLKDRSDRKIKNTDRSVKMLVKALEKACNGNYDHQEQIISNAIANAWKSFYALKPNEKPKPKQVVPDWM